MTFFEIIILSIALALDAMIVSFAHGLLLCSKRIINSIVLALFFGLFQFLMPLIGYYLTNIFYSKQKYTQPQLFAILAYKTYNKYDYRNTTENLKISTKLQKALKLKTIPHYTTIQKFFKKLSASRVSSPL